MVSAQYHHPPPPAPHPVEKLFSWKPVSGARKVGDHWLRVSWQPKGKGRHGLLHCYCSAEHTSSSGIVTFSLTLSFKRNVLYELPIEDLSHRSSHRAVKSGYTRIYPWEMLVQSAACFYVKGSRLLCLLSSWDQFSCTSLPLLLATPWGPVMKAPLPVPISCSIFSG